MVLHKYSQVLKVSGRNTTYKFNFFWFKDQIINSNFGENQILNLSKPKSFQNLSNQTKERLATPSFRSTPKGAGVSNDTKKRNSITKTRP